MSIAPVAVALLTIAIGAVGLVSPDLLTAIRHSYFASPTGFYFAGLLRATMGVIVLLSARPSKTPRLLWILGVVMCGQAVIAWLAGPERARLVLEWEAQQGATALRLGAIGALAAGCLLMYAVAGRRSTGPL